MCVIHAIARLLAFHCTLRLGAVLWLLAFPLAFWLRAYIAAWLLRIFTLHLAHWLATLSLASSALLARTEVLGANDFAVRLATRHLAIIGVEAFASR